ncbi:MAG TPA: hypothetical protein VFG04_09480 [Planctomycetaceae bacterium]|jgi:hypothetical protein|nr:hypothetical protein [Planctomycetaceae bacterium]
MGYVIKSTETNGRVTWLAAPSDLTRAHIFGSRDMAQVSATKTEAQQALQNFGPPELASERQFALKMLGVSIEPAE